MQGQDKSLFILVNYVIACFSADGNETVVRGKFVE